MERLNENEKLIMFSWGNFYLSSIQQGIQAGHCWMDMAVKYQWHKCSEHLCGEQVTETFWRWSVRDKVVNVRNGGEQEALRDLLTLFSREDNPYPWCEFREDEGLNHALTNVSIVVPEHVFAWEPINAVYASIGYETSMSCENPLTEFDKELYNLIQRTRHAI